MTVAAVGIVLEAKRVIRCSGVNASWKSLIAARSGSMGLGSSSAFLPQQHRVTLDTD